MELEPLIVPPFQHGPKGFCSWGQVAQPRTGEGSTAAYLRPMSTSIQRSDSPEKHGKSIYMWAAHELFMLSLWIDQSSVIRCSDDDLVQEWMEIILENQLEDSVNFILFNCSIASKSRNSDTGCDFRCSRTLPWRNYKWQCYHRDRTQLFGGTRFPWRFTRPSCQT